MIFKKNYVGFDIIHIKFNVLINNINNKNNNNCNNNYYFHFSWYICYNCNYKQIIFYDKYFICIYKGIY